MEIKIKNQAFSKIGILAIIIIAIAGGILVWQYNWFQAVQKLIISASPLPILTPESPLTSTPVLLGEPKLIPYTKFIKVELPLRIIENVNNLIHPVKTIIGEQGAVGTFEVHRSVDSDNNFIKIAEITNEPLYNYRYLAMFDTNYPKVAKTLYYKYKLRSISDLITESKVSTITVNYEAWQEQERGGHQPWRVDSLEVTRVEAGEIFREYCRHQITFETSCLQLTLTSVDENEGVATVQADILGITLLVKLRTPTMPVPSWTLWEIKENLGRG